MVFLLIAVTLDMDIAIFECPKPIIRQAWCISFKAILATRGHPGDHGSRRKDTCGSGTRISVILE